MYDPPGWRRRSGSCCTLPEPVDVRHMADAEGHASPSAWRTCAQLLRRGSFNFDEAVARADRVTVAVTLFALLELYKQGELTWTQDEPFGGDHDRAAARAPCGRRRGRG